MMEGETFKHTWIKERPVNSAIVAGVGITEPEGSLPYSQVPATCPYPESARSSPYSHIPLPEDPS